MEKVVSKEKWKETVTKETWIRVEVLEIETEKKLLYWRSRLLALLDRILDSFSTSWRSCALGVALSMLYLTGLISVVRGGGVGKADLVYDY